jgi:tetratricopeptide (TPR) repeat protein
MKKILIASILLLNVFFAVAQENAGATAKAFIRKGDYTNAIVVLNRAIESDKNNVELKKDLAFAYYLQRDFTKAIATIRPLIESKDTDEQSFQIAGMIYNGIEDRKESERIYKSGLKKFPSSGALYNEYGELLWGNSSFPEAIRQWLKGIQSDPNYSGNYYNAAKYYYLSADKIWGLIYGEIFVNLESYSKRTPEIKTILLEGYKKLYSETDLLKNQDIKNEFVKSYLDIMKNQSQVVGSGITPDALSALRTRFILSWFENPTSKLPFRLFEYQRQLARAGMFDAYNQWIFGAANNLTAFQQWTATHPEEYNRFNNFQRNRVFKLPEGQYYNNKP